MPVVGKTALEISNRAAFFKTAIDIQLAAPAMQGLGLGYHPLMPDILAHAYFAMSEAYKKQFLYPAKQTDPTKQAAITSAAIAFIKPLRPPDSRIQREEYIYVNPMMAMRAACGIVDHPFHTRDFDGQRRFFKQLDLLDFPNVTSIMSEAAANGGEIKGNLQITLTRQEEYQLKSLINMFVVLRDMKIYAKSSTP
ncbi:MAG: hypothetical protein K2X60_06535 [Xanthobacteraceae bacterium]|nr:hypothetical protein [Xanthobacteraceae bacterium]